MIEDPDAKYTSPDSELKLITDPHEWEFWVRNRNDIKPMQSYDIIPRRGNYITLQSQESVMILFRFLSYRKIDPQMASYENAEFLLQNKDDRYRCTYINKRTINIFIQPVNKEVSIQDKLGFKLSIEPHMNVIDHFFRYYEKENTDTKLVLPCLYNATEPPKQQASLYITHPGALVEWIN